MSRKSGPPSLYAKRDHGNLYAGLICATSAAILAAPFVLAYFFPAAVSRLVFGV